MPTAPAPRRLALAALFTLALLPGLPRALTASPLPQGSWTKVTASAEGTWRLLEEGGRIWLELDAAFETKAAPDLKLFLSPHAVGELDAENVTEGALLVGPLSGARGAQRHALPDGADLSKYRSLALHCERYGKLWAKAPL